MVFYCPICWSEVQREDQTCAYCGADLVVADARTMLEKLCSALKHPEPETAVRAAWILGERHEILAVPELVRTLETTTDGFLAEAAAEALGKIGDVQALDCLRVVSDRGSVRARIAAKKAVQEILTKMSTIDTEHSDL
jgi:HEAT repeat protein